MSARFASGNTDNRFRYLGRHGVVDEENGLNYIRARYYSARRGRFITKDPTTGTGGDSQSLNRYVYALNNPVRLIDISGLSAKEASGGTRLLATSDNSQFHNYLISPTTGGLAEASQTAGAGNAEFPVKIFKALLSVVPKLYKGFTEGFGTTASPSVSGVIGDVGYKALDVVAEGGKVTLENLSRFDAKVSQYLEDLKQGVPLSDILDGESTHYGLDYTRTKKERILRREAESQGISVTE